MATTRKYELKKRAEKQAETHQRIIDAAVALHSTIGPARTTLSAVAEKAGVQRLTLYRHFPDDLALLQACSGHYFALHPFPDTDAWQQISDPRERLRAALTGIYAFFVENEAMFSLGMRDAPFVPGLAEVSAPLFSYLEHLRDMLAAGWDEPAERRSLLLAAIGHALSFPTWQSLTREQGLEDAQVVELMGRLVECVVDGGAD